MCQILITIPPPIYLRIFFLLTIRKLSIHMVYARISHPKFFIALHFFFFVYLPIFITPYIYIYKQMSSILISIVNVEFN